MTTPVTNTTFRLIYEQFGSKNECECVSKLELALKQMIQEFDATEPRESVNTLLPRIGDYFLYRAKAHAASQSRLDSYYEYQDGMTDHEKYGD